MNEYANMNRADDRPANDSLGWLGRLYRAMPTLREESETVAALKIDLKCANANNQRLEQRIEALNRNQQVMHQEIVQLRAEVKELRMKQGFDACEGFKGRGFSYQPLGSNGILDIIGCLEGCEDVAREARKRV